MNAEMIEVVAAKDCYYNGGPIRAGQRFKITERDLELFKKLGRVDMIGAEPQKHVEPKGKYQRKDRRAEE